MYSPSLKTRSLESAGPWWTEVRYPIAQSFEHIWTTLSGASSIKKREQTTVTPKWQPAATCALYRGGPPSTPTVKLVYSEQALDSKDGSYDLLWREEDPNSEEGNRHLTPRLAIVSISWQLYLCYVVVFFLTKTVKQFGVFRRHIHPVTNQNGDPTWPPPLSLPAEDAGEAWPSSKGESFSKALVGLCSNVQNQSFGLHNV